MNYGCDSHELLLLGGGLFMSGRFLWGGGQSSTHGCSCDTSSARGSRCFPPDPLSDLVRSFPFAGLNVGSCFFTAGAEMPRQYNTEGIQRRSLCTFAELGVKISRLIFVHLQDGRSCVPTHTHRVGAVISTEVVTKFLFFLY